MTDRICYNGVVIQEMPEYSANMSEGIKNALS
jgi:hypothetical protein